MRVIAAICCLFILAYPTDASAQGYRPDKVSKKAAQLYEKAYEKASSGNSKEAIDLLQQATDADENYADAWIALAKLQAETKNYTYSIICFRRALSIDVEYFKPYLLSYAIALAGTGDFAKALEITNRYIDQNKPNGTALETALSRKKNFEFAVQQEKLTAASNEKTVYSQFKNGRVSSFTNHRRKATFFYPPCRHLQRRFLYQQRIQNRKLGGILSCERFSQYTPKRGSYDDLARWTMAGLYRMLSF
jgi:tetratricopeptide (TPR) repeat protein